MKTKDFYELMEEQERRKREAGAESTADLYRAVRNRFYRFCEGRRMSLKKMTASLVSEFAASLKREALRVNTQNSYLSCLRAMYRRACRELMLRGPADPFEGLQLKREETVKRAVPIDVIEKIACLDFKGCSAQEQAADLALFCFLACGMPFVDLVHLTKENIQEDGQVLAYRRQKTGVLIRIELNLGMKQLIAKYAREGSLRLFPVLPDNETHKEYKAALAEHNRQLKKIGERLNLAVPVTSYVFRHTWASEAYRRHVHISIISQALGHTTEKMTRHYLKALDVKEITRANERVIGSVALLMKRKEKPPLFMK